MPLTISNRRLVDAGPDFYPTPAWATQALLNYVEFKGRILEPCCGDGAMAEVLKAAGYDVVASDLYDRGYGSVRDFLSIKEQQDNIVTNAPFNKAEEMLLHALSLAKRKVCFLQRTAFLESVGRYHSIYSRTPPAIVLVFSERLSMYPKGHEVEGGGTTSYSWLIWDNNRKTDSTQVVWIAPGLKPNGRTRMKKTRRDHTGPPEVRWLTAEKPKSRAGRITGNSQQEEEIQMANKTKAAELHTVQPTPIQPSEPVTEQMLDEDEAEFNKLRRDLPGVKGASAAGIVTVTVSRNPVKNEFFRTHPEFRPVVPLVQHEEGMESHYYAVDTDMVVPLKDIGIDCVDHTLYLIVTPRGGVRIIPINCTADNEWLRTKEIGLLDGIKRWVRIYSDKENTAYKVYPAPDDRYADPIWPELKPAKIFRLAFRDKNRLIDSPEHVLFKRWAARDRS